MSPPPRVLPLRVPVAPDEPLDSWLEALARRSQATVTTLASAFGWQVPGARGSLVAGIPGAVLRRIEYQAGLPPGRLDAVVLDRYLPLGAVRRDGSWYCPDCLAARDGRWLLAWRLPWTFACTTHRLLLCDTCPACGRIPRERTGPAGLNLPGTCPAATARHTYCGADLREAAVRRLPPGDPVLAAQDWATTLLSQAGPGQQSAVARVLTDLGIVASWILRHAPASHFADYGPDAPAAAQAWRQQSPASQARHFPPPSAALTGALAAAGMTMLAGGDTAAIERIRALLPPHGDLRRARPAGMPARHWARLSAAAQGRFLRALDPHLGSAERIRYRTGIPGARIPGDPPRLLAARARAVPQLLWPEWAIRLTPPEGLLPGPFRSALAACLLLPGHPAAATRKAITGLHAYRSVFAVNAVLRALAAHHDSVLAAVACLAAYLDDCGSPVDYQRRRDLIPAQPISLDQWRELCLNASAHPGEARRHRDAQRYLFQLLTGADLNDPRHALAFTRASDRARYQAFADTHPTSLRTALHRHAAALLDGLRISEPLTWAPPPGCCAGLSLPGPGPEDIDTEAVRRLVITGKASVSDAAAELGTSAGHVRFALERVPRPARNWGPGALPVTWRRQQRARAVLTREFFDLEYLQAGKTLQDLEAETGFPVKLLAATAREHGITLTRASAPAPIGGDWLREQYQARHRSYTGIAAELGVRPETVIAAARRHHIPSRPFTVHSRPEMTTRLEAAVPRDIRRAVEGSLQGWHRLRRFQAAMAFPTIEAAAAHLGTSQSALIHQLRRLERDIGAPLYHASSPGKPMQPTRRGTALLAALDRPDIHALAMEHAPDMSGPASSRNPGHEPAAPGPAAATAQQAAPLFRALAEPTRLAILLTLQDGEQRITDLAAQLGATQTAVSSHITVLKDRGLITGRPQGRSVYYRLARPHDLTTLLGAAEQLLAATRQPPEAWKQRLA